MKGLSDAITVAAIAVLAYVSQNVLHEGIGHGGACLLVGGKPLLLSTAYFDWDHGEVAASGRSWVAAAGSLVNLISGIGFWLWLRHAQRRSAHLRYFLWLSMTIGFMTATGYLLFSGVLGVGDWQVIIANKSPQWLWRFVLILTGTVLYTGSIWFALRELSLLIGADQPERLRRAFKLTFPPYIAGSAVSTIGAFLNPKSLLFAATSAAAAFGGTSGLAWMSQLYRSHSFPLPAEPALRLTRHWGWIGAALMTAALHIFVLGPEITF